MGTKAPDLDESVDRSAWLAREFERHRGHLRAVGYRMLGSMTEAEDAVQETWIRLQRSDPGGTDDLRGWLTVTLGRICIDMLRMRRSRRESNAGTWLPEPLVSWPGIDGGSTGSPEREVVLADSVGIALLVVLDRLSPPERLAFVLHDVFGIPFDDIARIVERTPEAARQLASRARRRVRAEAPPADADVQVQHSVVDAFRAAARDGDFEGLLRVLDPEVVLRIDFGPHRALARPEFRGAEEVIRQARNFGGQFAAYARPITVNGEPGAVIDAPGQPRFVATFSVRRGRIVAIHLNADPAKISRIP
jgi:RNA polymerase sigma-70 factor, ECF subfamily